MSEQICNQCEMPLADGAAFCGWCGSRVVANPPVAVEAEPVASVVAAQCRGCGEELVDGARFCLACGTGVNGEQASTPAELAASIRRLPRLGERRQLMDTTEPGSPPESAAPPAPPAPSFPVEPAPEQRPAPERRPAENAPTQRLAETTDPTKVMPTHGAQQSDVAPPVAHAARAITAEQPIVTRRSTPARTEPSFERRPEAPRSGRPAAPVPASPPARQGRFRGVAALLAVLAVAGAAYLAFVLLSDGDEPTVGSDAQDPPGAEEPEENDDVATSSEDGQTDSDSTPVTTSPTDATDATDATESSSDTDDTAPAANGSGVETSLVSLDIPDGWTASRIDTEQRYQGPNGPVTLNSRWDYPGSAYLIVEVTQGDPPDGGLEQIVRDVAQGYSPVRGPEQEEGLGFEAWSFDFRRSSDTVVDSFRLIDDRTVAVVVRDGDAAEARRIMRDVLASVEAN